MRIKRKVIRETYTENRLSTIFVLPKQMVCYVPVPKAGCSTLKLTMDRIYTGNHERDVVNIHERRKAPSPFDVTWPKMRELQKDGLFGFTVVREPIRRAVSAFIDKRRQRKYRGFINKALGREDLFGKITFEDFVTGLENSDPITMDPHWRPQHLVTMYNGVEYDHIAKLENLKDEWPIICEKAKIPVLELPHRNKNEKKLVQEVTDDQRARLTKIYERDFEIFGY